MKAIVEIELLEVKGQKITKQLENPQVEESFLKMLQPFVDNLPKVVKKNGIKVKMAIRIDNGK